MPKKLDDEIMSENFDIVVIFRIFGQFGAVQRDTDSAKLMFSLIVTFCLTKIENRTRKSLYTAVALLFWVKVFFG